MNKINKKHILVFIATISVLFLLYLILGMSLAYKTYTCYKKSEKAEEYVESSFISEKQYVNLSPYKLQIYNTDGSVKDNVTNIECETRYYIIFPFVTISKGQLVLHGSYSYAFSFVNDADIHSSASMGEVDLFYRFGNRGFYISNIRYGV